MVGWAKRGPQGLIGDNAKDARETVASLLADAPQGTTGADIVDLLAARDVTAVRFADWERIDAEELRIGQAAGRLREKFTDVDAMLAAADLA